MTDLIREQGELLDAMFEARGRYWDCQDDEQACAAWDEAVRRLMEFEAKVGLQEGASMWRQ